MALPIKTETAVAGFLTLGRGCDRPRTNEQDLAAVMGMCRRAAMAIENLRLNQDRARLAEHDRTVAQALQEALLTVLPELPGVKLDARYLSAADRVHVGGDWYDALADSSGAVTITIGDVMGHDLNAAAKMGQLRSTLRTLSWIGDSSPSVLLTQLDRAADDMYIRTMATVLTAKISPIAGDGYLPERVMQWSSAGHPPPIVVHADGRTQVLRTGRRYNDPPIGVLRGVRRHDNCTLVPVDSMLFLYTDGLVETRTDDIEQGIKRLCRVLSRHHDEPVSALLDAVLSDMVSSRAGDDIAMLAVRMTA